MNSEIRANCEIVVVDDGGHDNLAVTLAGLPITILSTRGSGSAAVARNRGAKGFAGRYMIFIDADVLVLPHCLERFLAPLRRGQADATVGNYSRDVAGLSFAARYKQLYIAHVHDRRRGYLKNFWTAIGAIDARLFHAFGGFDTAFKGANGEDAELGYRLSEKGYRILAVSDALGQHRRLLTLRRIVLNDWRKGIGAMQHYYRSTGAMSDNYHATLRDQAAVVLTVLTLGLTVVMFLAGASPGQSILAAGTCATVYLAVRSDIIASFLSQGTGFVFLALAVMALLDLVRCACVSIGVCLRLRHLAHARALRSGRMINSHGEI
jgi:cellulose synthase/poly-beta-1,6-N-acetylglucosamine synthase-like glycosyltransferase